MAKTKDEERDALAKEKEAELDALQSEKAALEKRNENFILGAAGLLSFAVLTAGFLWIRRRRSSSHQDVESADVVLRGREFTIKLHGNLLSRERGAVLGRSAAERLCVGCASVSRAHCKVFEGRPHLCGGPWLS